MIFAGLATVLFALSATCANRSSRLVGGVEANHWRLLLAAFFLAGWALTVGQGLQGRALPVFLISGVVGIGIGDFGLFQSFPRLGARLTMLLTLCFTSPMGVLFEWVWLGQRLRAPELGCIGLILIGVVITLWPDRKVPLPRRDLVVGVLYAALSASGGAMGVVLSRHAYAICRANNEVIDGPTAAFQRVLGGVLVTSAIFFVLRFRQKRTGRLPGAIENKWQRLLPWTVGNALAGLTVGVSCMQRALETTPAGVVLAIIAITPIAVIPLARMVDGERVTTKALVGSIVGVLGAGGLAMVR